MRTRTILAAAAAPAALAAALLGASPAFASTGPAGNGQTGGHLTGNKAAVYNDSYFGPVSCNETQHPQFDTVSCHFTGGQTMSPGQPGTVGWNSDFGPAAAPNGASGNGTTSVHPLTGTLTYTINADGTGYTGQATYPAS
jgi:hypothetical protein